MEDESDAERSGEKDGKMKKNWDFDRLAFV